MRSIQSPSEGERLGLYTDAIERMARGEGVAEWASGPDDAIGRLGRALQRLDVSLERRRREAVELDRIAARINAGLLLDDILENAYRDLRAVIPYNRIGLALIEEDGGRVRSRWARSDQPRLALDQGYSAPLAGSSLERIIATGKPRILDDLEAYLRERPESQSTRLITAEGMRSSLTCPLVANGVPVGFVFFSSVTPNTYADAHVGLFNQIAAQLSVGVEKGRLVSEIAAQKAAIEARNEELRRLNEQKNKILGVAAHDLRNPVTVIQMASCLLTDPGVELSREEYQSFLHDILEQSRHMLALLEDLLDVQQIESGELRLRRCAVDLGSFLEDTVGRHASLAKPKNTRILLETPPEGTVSADPLRLRQVFDNLVSNAVKFSPPGSTVRVRAEFSDEGWRVSVQDQGPGITREDRERLFEEFARLSAQPTGGERSTGLGLAISRRVVEAHGGRIGVDSAPGCGSSFWFTLPAHP